ncbi:MAG TPA: NTP transferase domain-containing protein [Methanothermobacter sp.]|jgi:molybdenum cofactor cytidylyltransferase|uniref:Glycosyl transferase n=1 Tax=Methanothermobacter tenebrarum TaxID=680118 RepID=A0ABM7YE49_9EURY|nr:NTP transferase domain-containing protein [Methanothermobacter tenebrarum]MDD3454151.1 NTP transferase domain-containing protein [Methanobacteriales archaeon]MDI6881320.1 NTP transferase domain-containing protein [Methanothermobacter sp.]MDX9693147.1 NTP transferase domain-containing protein [Methanothermobacter sp.]BDH79594.1 glycosyl transferase [Methanothermobacter tenebrarum]HHW15856.1 NTP transferase domain-containing protein [Methanothermobacter sp.]
MRVSGIITAAGKGERMKADMKKRGLKPKHKLLLKLDDRTVIEKTISNVLEAGVDECIVVVGHQKDNIIPVISSLDVKIVENQDDLPLTGSLLNGVENARGRFCLCVAGDQPTITSRTYKRIIKALEDNTVSILGRGSFGRLDNPRGLGMPFAAPRKLLLEYLPSYKGNINPLLWRLVEDGIGLYAIRPVDEIELINLNTFDDYLKIKFGN